MTKYRVYEVGADGRFIGFEPMICADDEEAIETARRLFKDSHIEVWSGPRLVIWTRLEGPGESPESFATRAPEDKEVRAGP
jgi:hypothetical protein